MSARINDIRKNGFHPTGGRVTGMLGRGKKDPSKDAHDHVSRPISTLKDPAAFGPPPKNINYHGGAALPNQITPDRRGLGAPLSRDEIYAKRAAEEEEEQRQAEEAAMSRPTGGPFRADTTGLSTAHLPPPPGRKDGADGREPVQATKAKPPGLPPRLPPRQMSNPAPSPSPMHSPGAVEPDSHRGVLNQGSLGRLGAAGVSVPAFGIGERGKQSLPPPSHSPANNGPQLSELQSRFSRLSASTSPQANSPSEGTTFAQKQAAFKTASALRDDPSSVSLSDARSAASTANNFRERHGEQVQSGWKSANKMNNKYGITEKVGAFGENGLTQSPGSANEGIEMRDNTAGGHTISGVQNSAILGKKKPPPPPVKKASLQGSTFKESMPPQLPLSTKPKPQSPSPLETQDLELDLQSLWFAKSPPVFPPPSVNRLPGKRSYASSSSWSSSGVRKTHTFIGAIRDSSTLATTKIRLTWDASNPSLTISAQQKHYPPPRKLSTDELERYRERYSDAVAAWCESKMGQQVGDGECWTLAHDALVNVASVASSRGQEPCMTSQSYVHGSLIFSNLPAISPYPEPRGGVLEAGVARGDLLQLLSAHFKAKNGRSEKWAGAPDHTAVVVGVQPNGVLQVVEQNVGNVKRVQQGSYDMSELVKGEVRIFRAAGESWVGKLEATW